MAQQPSKTPLGIIFIRVKRQQNNAGVGSEQSTVKVGGGGSNYQIAVSCNALGPSRLRGKKLYVSNQPVAFACGNDSPDQMVIFMSAEMLSVNLLVIRAKPMLKLSRLLPGNFKAMLMIQTSYCPGPGSLRSIRSN